MLENLAENHLKVPAHAVQSVHFSVKAVLSEVVGASDSVGSLGTLAYVRLFSVKCSTVFANQPMRESLWNGTDDL